MLTGHVAVGGDELPGREPVSFLSGNVGIGVRF